MQRILNVVTAVGILMVVQAGAADVDSPAAPTSAASAMYSLEDIYNRLDTGAVGSKRTGAFTEPSSGPSATRKTLDDVMAKAPAADATNGAAASEVLNGKTYFGLSPTGWGPTTGTRAPMPVRKTGQATSYTTTGGEDGDLQKGVAWPNPRFTDNGNGTVTDNLTKLVWLKDAGALGSLGWDQALTACNSLASGQAGLTDGSQAGDWRLPNACEYFSLSDLGRSSPALPAGHPFTNVPPTGVYWSSTTDASATDQGVNYHLQTGRFSNAQKGTAREVWAVRGGQ